MVFAVFAGVCRIYPKMAREAVATRGRVPRVGGRKVSYAPSGELERRVTLLGADVLD